jgi:L-ascorbate metabolism protein UlaG (beta-lactamase superfamily)
MVVVLKRQAARAAAAAALLCTLPLAAMAAEDACHSLTPAMVGGPMLAKSRETIVLRWLGTANYELAYKGHVYLLDTYYDRGPRDHPIGITVDQVKKATAIFIGHGHFDHVSDVVPVARQTKAPVIGAPVTIEAAEKMGLPASQAVTVSGGETLHYPGVTVDTALARHSELEAEVLKATGGLFKLEDKPLSPEDEAARNTIRARGTFSPDVITKGTIAYAFTFDTGFKLLFLDSAGPITDGDRELAKKLGRVDVAIVSYQGHPTAERQVAATLPLIELFRPRIYLPAHHDQSFGAFLDLGVEPLFTAIREALPDARTIQPLYRTPICIDVSKKGRT